MAPHLPRVYPHPVVRLHPFAELLLGLYSPEQVVRFAIQWLGPAFQPLGPWLAGNYAEQVAAEVEKRGMLRDKVFWDALVIDRPFRAEEIRTVERLFAPPKPKPKLKPKPLQALMLPRAFVDRAREDAYIRSLVNGEYMLAPAPS